MEIHYLGPLGCAVRVTTFICTFIPPKRVTAEPAGGIHLLCIELNWGRQYENVELLLRPSRVTSRVLRGRGLRVTSVGPYDAISSIVRKNRDHKP